MKNTILIITLLCLGSRFAFCHNESEAYNFTYLTADDGMAQNMIDYIYQDSRGFMWFATWNGLNRYDGYEFVRYSINTSNPINSLFVHTLIEDDFGRLWVGTEEGLNFIDVYSGDINCNLENSIRNFKLSKAFVNAFLKDSSGNIWVGYDGGLSVVTFTENGDIRSVHVLQEEENADVLSLCEDKNGTVWAGYRYDGVKLITRVSESSFSFNNPQGFLLPHFLGEVFTLCAHKDHVWIGSGTGLFDYDLNTRQFIHHTNKRDDYNSLIQDYVKYLLVDQQERLIIATYKGISIYDIATGQFQRVTGDGLHQKSLNNNFVNSLYEDSNGTLWIGTEAGGVNKMTKKEIIFGVYQYSVTNPKSLSSNFVNAIFEDSRGNLWIGLVEGGLNKKVSGKPDFIHYKTNPADQYALSHNTVSFLTEGGGYLWIATWGGGINRMPLNREGFFENDKQFITGGALENLFISTIQFDVLNNGLWIGSPSGLEFYDIEDGSVKPILKTAEPDFRITGVSTMFIVDNKALWAGTAGGLRKIDLEVSEIRAGKIASKRYLVNESEKNIPKLDKINYVYKSDDNNCWIGTYGNGLYKLTYDEYDEYEFFNYGTDAGLSDNVVYSIQEDKRGNLWMSTNRGISCFYPDKESATAFYQTDGLPANQFYWMASCKRRNGQLLFGSVRGAVSFDPLEILPDTSQLVVSIVDGKVYNERVNPMAFRDKWELHESDKSFSIQYSSLNYDVPEKIRYAYFLEGFDQGWMEDKGGRRFATYTNLSAGKYTFHVRCTNPDGEWSDRVTQLSIVIVPPFYKEKWFLFLIMVLFLLAIYSFYSFRMRNLRRQTVLLEQMVEERTEKIESQKNILSRQARDLEKTLGELMVNQRELAQKNEVLMEQNQKISNQKHQLEILSDKLQMATQDKINFFTNITHEFKTPLTLIIGPIEQALKLSYNPQVIEQLELVRKNSRYLLSLINQLMDFRKADSQKLQVNKTPGNFQEFLQALVKPFETLVANRGIEIHFYERFANPYFQFDHDLMQKVLVNLLSNAAKFTPDRGLIRVSATLFSCQENKDSHLYISVTDSGTGVPEDKADKIFEPFYQLDNRSIYPVYGQSGTGIGLYLCRQIIQLLGGTIQLRNMLSGGASFRVVLPVEKKDMEVDSVPEIYEMPDTDQIITKIPDEETESSDKPLLLVVEDNTDMRAFIKSILKENYQVIEAANGQQGLDKTLKYMPDFILSDIMMPVMDGLELCRKIKNNFATSHIPVLLLTAKSSTDVRIEGYNVGADGYIAKPFSAELLEARINNMLESRNRYHQVFEKSMDVHSLEMTEKSQDRIFMDKIMENIRENYQDTSFDVTELQEKMHVSKTLMHKKLNSLTGQSAVKMIRTYRLSKAKELIESVRNSNEPVNIAEVAYAVGFNDPKYFTRCFTKQFGVNPSLYLEKKDS